MTSESSEKVAHASTPSLSPTNEMLSNSTNVCFLDKLQLLRIVPVSPTGLHELMVSAGFPRPFVLNGDPNSVTGKSYWNRAEVEAWLLARPRRILKSDLAEGERK